MNVTDDSNPTVDDLPGLTPLQFLVIWLLLDGRKTGRTLRRQLDPQRGGMDRTGFSHLMRRLQDADLVRSDTVSEDSEGPPKRYCVYQARVKGLKRWRAARDFYTRLEEPADAEDHLFDEAIQRREDQEFEDSLHQLGPAYAQARQVLEERERDEAP